MTERIEILFGQIKEQMPNNFARERVLKELGVSYEYLVYDQWTPGPPAQKPQDRRVVFEPAERFVAAQDVYNTWVDLEARKAYDSTRPEVIIARFVAARTEKRNLTLFIPWGVRTEGKFGPEIAVLDIIQSEVTSLEAKAIRTQTLLMPADLYATEVNRINSDKAARYFDRIADEAAKRGLNVKTWSEIRTENMNNYQTKAAHLTPEKIEAILSVPVLEGAKKAARRRSGYSSRWLAEEAAYTYLRERIAEAEIVEERYRPVKFSLVFKNKDNEVDRDLPRIYIIPERLQGPWLIT